MGLKRSRSFDVFALFVTRYPLVLFKQHRTHTLFEMFEKTKICYHYYFVCKRRLFRNLSFFLLSSTHVFVLSIFMRHSKGGSSSKEFAKCIQVQNGISVENID